MTGLARQWFERRRVLVMDVKEVGGVSDRGGLPEVSLGNKPGEACTGSCFHR
jgi:hypothetical protein